MAACRLASKGKTLADSSFQSEIQSIHTFLAMQKTNSGTNSSAAAGDESINAYSLVSPRYHKKNKAKQVEVEEVMFRVEHAVMFVLICYHWTLKSST